MSAVRIESPPPRSPADPTWPGLVGGPALAVVGAVGAFAAGVTGPALFGTCLVLAGLGGAATMVVTRLRAEATALAAERATLEAELRAVAAGQHQLAVDRAALVADQAAVARGREALAAELAALADRREPPSSVRPALDEAKEAFLGVLSHELRTPINVVMGYASLMADDVSAPLTDDQQTYVGRILEGTEALLTLVNDMLDMGRIQAGQLNVSPVPVAFAEVAEATLADLAEAAAGKALEVRLEAPADLPPVMADEQRLHQVLRALVSNAVKFTPPGGAIAVRARAVPEGRLYVEIADTGIGIAPADLSRIFQRFEQGDGATTRAFGGTGLGLAIARSLIEMQGGAIGAESLPGEGSTFWFELPLAPAA